MWVDGAAATADHFLSTRLVRELIRADVEPQDGRRPEEPVERLLRVVLSGVGAAAGALLSANDFSWLLAQGLTGEECAFLASSEAGIEPLARRALAERRVFLLGRASREPLVPRLREIEPDRASAAIVPLSDRDGPLAALLLVASREDSLTPATLRSLAPAFRLLAVLLRRESLARSSETEEEPRPSTAYGETSESERYAFEIDELRASLAETRELLAQVEQQSTTSQAAHRVEVESLRARLAHAEASALGDRGRASEHEELAVECSRRGFEIEERDRRIRDLESELERLAAMVAPQVNDTDPQLDTNVEEVTEILDTGDDRALGEIAAEAARAIETIEESDGTLELTPDEDPGEEILAANPEEGEAAEHERAEDDTAEVGAPSESLATPEQEQEQSLPLALWHVDHDPDARTWASDLAGASGAALWNGEGAPVGARRNVLAMNLFDAALERAVGLADQTWESTDAVVYAADPEQGTGFELGSVCWLCRPVDPDRLVERLKKVVGRKLGGIMMVSARLRELAGVRQALAKLEASGSVACDARQATDLLDIVGRPDAVLIDLALEGGQGLLVAKQLRSQSETSSVPLILLTPEAIDPERLRRDADRARVLGPYAPIDARRLINSALARHG